MAVAVGLLYPQPSTILFLPLFPLDTSDAEGCRSFPLCHHFILCRCQLINRHRLRAGRLPIALARMAIQSNLQGKKHNKSLK